MDSSRLSSFIPGVLQKSAIEPSKQTTIRIGADRNAVTNKISDKSNTVLHTAHLNTSNEQGTSRAEVSKLPPNPTPQPNTPLLNGAPLRPTTKPPTVTISRKTETLPTNMPSSPAPVRPTLTKQVSYGDLLQDKLLSSTLVKSSQQKIESIKVNLEFKKIFNGVGEEIRLNSNTNLAKTGADEPNAAAKEKRLQLLQETVVKNPEIVKKIIANNRHDPLFQELGAINFVSYLLISKQNVAKHGSDEVKNIPLTDCQRVALYGYTTGDYGKINNALRTAGDASSIKDPKLQSYTKHVIEGMKLLPDYKGEGPLYRGIRNAPSEPGIKDPTEAKNAWKEKNLKDGGTYKDSGVGSSMTRNDVEGDYKFMIVGTKNAKDLGPFSAFPLEREIAFLPNTKFTVDKEGLKEALPPYSNLNNWFRMTPAEIQ